jgi:hypothetical protein
VYHNDLCLRDDVSFAAHALPSLLNGLGMDRFQWSDIAGRFIGVLLDTLLTNLLASLANCSGREARPIEMHKVQILLFH